LSRSDAIIADGATAGIGPVRLTATPATSAGTLLQIRMRIRKTSNRILHRAILESGEAGERSEVADLRARKGEVFQSGEAGEL